MSPDRKVCPAEITLRLIDHRWKLLIFHELLRGTRRFSNLQRRIPGVSHRVLATELRELERDGLVQREVFPEVPPRVEYSLTRVGKSLKPVFLAMHDWGARHAKRLSRFRERPNT